MGVKQPDEIERALERLLRQLGSDNSRRVYASDWNRFLSWLDSTGLTLTDVKPRHVEDHIIYLGEDGCQRSTCGRALSVIRAVFGILVRDEIVPQNPAREVKNPKFDSTPKVPVLTEEQAKALLNLPDDTWKQKRDKLCVEILLGLGWRRSEVARMRREDFAEDGSAISKKKGNKTRATGVPKFITEKILEWCRYAGIDEGPIFIRSRDDRREISGDIVYKIVRGALTQAGISEGSPHALRRTFATLLYKRGSASLRELQIALSHESSVTTERYTKVVDAHKISPGDGLEDLFSETTRSGSRGVELPK